MNKKKLPGIFGLSAMALGLLAGCASSGEEAPADPILSDEVVNTADGYAIAFGNHVKKADEANAAHSVLGVSLTEAEGVASLRFVAALDGYAGLSKASWVRSVKDGETPVKEEASFDVHYVYAALNDADDIVWSTALDAEKTYYYVTYTLNNIPEDHWWDEIDVSFKAYDLTGAEAITIDDRANVWGIKGDPTVGSVSYTQYTEANAASIASGNYIPSTGEAGTAADYAGKYWARITASTEGDVNVSSFVWSLVDGEDHLAENLGEVVSAGDILSSNGFCENRTIGGHIQLPDTIRVLNKWGLAGSDIGSINFPSSMAVILGSCISASTDVGILYFDCVNLVSITSGNYFRAGHIDEVHVGAGVEALPTQQLFADDETIPVLHYDGTEAEWAALATDTSSSHFTSSMVICNDTILHEVTFDLAGGSIGENEESVVVTAIQGKTVRSPGRPLKAGMRFAGWTLDATENPVEIVDLDTYIVNGPVTLTAVYEDLPAGKSLDDPYELNATFDGTVTTEVGMDTFFVKFTAPATDRYWFILGSATDIDEENSNYTWADPYISFYDSAKEAKAVDGTTLNYQWSAGQIRRDYSSDIWALDLNEGDVIYAGIEAYYNSSYPERVMYATVPLHIMTANGDSTADAFDLEWGVETRVNFNGSEAIPVVYKLAAGEWGGTSSQGFSFGGDDSIYTSVAIYEPTSETPNTTLLSGSSGTTSRTTRLVNLDRTKDHYIVVDSNLGATQFAAYVNGDTSTYIGIDNPPAGSSSDTPSAVTIGDEAVVSTPYNNSLWYSFTVETAGSYRMVVNADDSEYRKGVRVYAASDLANPVFEFIETLQTGSSWWFTPEYELIDKAVDLTAGSYVVEVFFEEESNVTYASLSFRVAEAVPGYSIEAPAALSVEAGAESLVLDGLSLNDPRYFSFTSVWADTLDFVADDETATIALYDAEGNILASGIGSFHYTVEDGTAYIIGVVSSVATTVTVGVSTHVGALSNYAFAIGIYNGCMNGSSYYEINIDIDTFTFDRGSTVFSIFSATDYGNGVVHIVGGNDYYDFDLYADANGNIIGRRDSSDIYLSKNQSYYDSSIISGQRTGTSDYNIDGTGMKILSIAIDGDERIYGAIIEGIFYPTVTVEFSSGTAINETNAVFTVSAYGALLGTVTVSSSAGTACTWAPAAA